MLSPCKAAMRIGTCSCTIYRAICFTIHGLRPIWSPATTRIPLLRPKCICTHLIALPSFPFASLPPPPNPTYSLNPCVMSARDTSIHVEIALQDSLLEMIRLCLLPRYLFRWLCRDGNASCLVVVEPGGSSKTAGRLLALAKGSGAFGSRTDLLGPII